MKVPYAILATLVVLGLLAAPLALAAAGSGKAAEHANAHAARGLEQAAAGADEDADETERAAGMPAHAQEARERGLRMGFAHALEQVPSWVKVKLENLLAGLLPAPGKA